MGSRTLEHLNMFPRQINEIDSFDIIPKLNKSREASLIVDCVGLGIDVVEGDGVIVGVERSLPACRTGLVDDTGAANGFFNFGILF